jgi:HTH-type transcriptional regulator/antitoxin HipB
MKIRTPSDLGALIRDRRTKMGLDQLSLAQRAGTGRKWIVEIEKGKPRAAIGLVLRTLQALGVSLDVSDDKNAIESKGRRNLVPSVDINQHLERLSRKQ